MLNIFGTPSDRNINELRREKQYNLQDVPAAVDTFGTPSDGNNNDLRRGSPCNLQYVHAIIDTFATTRDVNMNDFNVKINASCKTSWL